jgi:hypothetical protein
VVNTKVSNDVEQGNRWSLTGKQKQSCAESPYVLDDDAADVDTAIVINKHCHVPSLFSNSSGMPRFRLSVMACGMAARSVSVGSGMSLTWTTISYCAFWSNLLWCQGECAILP